MRIQFDISEEDASRLAKYIPDIRYRHGFGHKALTEWITRQEGRDKRIKDERKKQKAKEMQELIDSGLVNVKAP